jgi:hypothetical protein
MGTRSPFTSGRLRIPDPGLLTTTGYVCAAAGIFGQNSRRSDLVLRIQAGPLAVQWLAASPGVKNRRNFTDQLGNWNDLCREI